MEIWERLALNFTWEKAMPFIYAGATLILGIFLAKLVSAIIGRGLQGHIKGAKGILLRRLVFYLLFFVVIMLTLEQAGYNIKVLWGAAGILSIAIGFASQTSASNFISGLFLIAERPFDVGDSVKIGTTTGQILSIDMLSVKLRTWENLFVRIPNETMVKSEITNFSRFPIRRFDIRFEVAFGTDLERVREILMEVAEKNRDCLQEPEPNFRFSAFGLSGLTIDFLVWSEASIFIAFRTDFLMGVKQAFEKNDINIALPQRILSFQTPVQVSHPEQAGVPDQTP